jgi:hypothetical protein
MSQNVNSQLYTVSATTTSQSITLNPNDVFQNNITVTNEGAQAVFVVTSSAAITAVFPTSSLTVGVNGSVVLAGQSKTFYKNTSDNIIALIRPAAAAAGNVYIDVGSNFANE